MSVPLNSVDVSNWLLLDGALDVPLSPFMTTHILDPTHLSISSIDAVSETASFEHG